MTTLDDKLVPKVRSIIEKFGRIATFTEVTETYSPASGGVVKTKPDRPYKRKISPLFDYELRYVDGDVIQVGDMKTLVAAQNIPFTPVKAMTLTVGTDVWTIMSVKPIDTGEKTAAYELQLRR